MKALISGASQGIGKAISLVLAGKGYDLILCARGLQLLKDLKTEIQFSYPERMVYLYPVDFGNQLETAALLKKLDEEKHAPDLLVNNVGMYKPVSLLDESDEDFFKMMQVNLYAAYSLSKWSAKHMVRCNAGHIFSIVSVGGKEAVPGAGSYSVSKFALRGFMLNLRNELKTSGVKVTSILPGSTLTASWQGTELPHEQFVQPEDIASALLTCLEMSKGANVEELIINPLNFDIGS